MGCNPWDPLAVLRILALKNRSIEKGLILVADSLSRLSPFIRELPEGTDLHTEGRAVTWLVRHGGHAPDWITGGRDTLAIRVSEHKTVKALCSRARMSLVSTSANPAGKLPALTALRVRSYFGNLIDVIVPGNLGGQNGASELRDLQTGQILRQAAGQ